MGIKQPKNMKNNLSLQEKKTEVAINLGKIYGFFCVLNFSRSGYMQSGMPRRPSQIPAYLIRSYNECNYYIETIKENNDPKILELYESVFVGSVFNVLEEGGGVNIPNDFNSTDLVNFMLGFCSVEVEYKTHCVSK